MPVQRVLVRSGSSNWFKPASTIILNLAQQLKRTMILRTTYETKSYNVWIDLISRWIITFLGSTRWNTGQGKGWCYGCCAVLLRIYLLHERKSTGQRSTLMKPIVSSTPGSPSSWAHETRRTPGSSWNRCPCNAAGSLCPRASAMALRCICVAGYVSRRLIFELVWSWPAPCVTRSCTFHCWISATN